MEFNLIRHWNEIMTLLRTIAAAIVVSLVLAGCSKTDEVDKQYEALKTQIGHVPGASVASVEALIGPIPASERSKRKIGTLTLIIGMPASGPDVVTGANATAADGTVQFGILFKEACFSKEFQTRMHNQPTETWAYFWSPPGKDDAKQLFILFEGDKAVGTGVIFTK